MLLAQHPDLRITYIMNITREPLTKENLQAHFRATRQLYRDDRSCDNCVYLDNPNTITSEFCNRVDWGYTTCTHKWRRPQPMDDWGDLDAYCCGYWTREDGHGEIPF